MISTALKKPTATARLGLAAALLALAGWALRAQPGFNIALDLGLTNNTFFDLMVHDDTLVAMGNRPPDSPISHSPHLRPWRTGTHFFQYFPRHSDCFSRTLIEVTDVSGKTIASKVFKDQRNVNLNLSDYPGLNLIRIYHEDGTVEVLKHISTK